MGSSLRRFFGYVLLVLLPLQAMASSVTRSCASEMPNCPAMQAKMGGCCEHSPLSFSKHLSGTSMSHVTPSSADDHGSMGSCGLSTTCDVPMPAAALPSDPYVFFSGHREQPSPDVTSFYLSFIPDSPQRPPSLLA